MSLPRCMGIYIISSGWSLTHYSQQMSFFWPCLALDQVLWSLLGESYLCLSNGWIVCLRFFWLEKDIKSYDVGNHNTLLIGLHYSALIKLKGGVNWIFVFAKEALAAFCKDEDLFGGAWGHGVKPEFPCKELQGVHAALWLWGFLVRCRIRPHDPSRSRVLDLQPPGTWVQTSWGFRLVGVLKHVRCNKIFM